MNAMYGVYRIMANGMYKYVPRTVTHNKKLAEEIAADLTEGRVVLPDGSSTSVKPFPHVVKRIGGA